MYDAFIWGGLSAVGSAAFVWWSARAKDSPVSPAPEKPRDVKPESPEKFDGGADRFVVNEWPSDLRPSDEGARYFGHLEDRIGVELTDEFKVWCLQCQFSPAEAMADFIKNQQDSKGGDPESTSSSGSKKKPPVSVAKKKRGTS